ncbi:hypothetical protein B6U98_04695 [Thermoplasmatales archaeon ex4572_165]|nr:MAG: hypothetical protein B6U98_04695 [Thermoplasmatales archaeon ex4572_165]RLF57946.1 MAG: hypothetical protein DRN27_06680 [Thermoplasmata archaeon]
MKIMNCLVTGAAGFIGSALVQRLASEGHQVKGLIHKNKPLIKSENIFYVQGDLSDDTITRDLAKNMDVVFHCAGLVNDFGKKNDFYKAHVTGTKNLVRSCKRHQCKKFVFLSHIPYESNKMKHPYQKTKEIAESYLFLEYKKNHFPIVIIRPGNVYGPNANTWVNRPLKAINKGRIALINKGEGIFLHTYIDNLIDSLILTMNTSGIDGEIIEITDGDNSITWGRYLNDLSEIVGKKHIKRNISKSFALIIGNMMIFMYSLFGVKPLLTPYAVEIFSNKKKISIEKANKLLNYQPQIDYETGMNIIKEWVHEICVDSL